MEEDMELNYELQENKSDEWEKKYWQFRYNELRDAILKLDKDFFEMGEQIFAFSDNDWSKLIEICGGGGSI
jgi:hypothetical protein